MDYIHITHKNLADGVLIAASEFDPAVHTRFGEAQAPAAEPATAPPAEPETAPPADAPEPAPAPADAAADGAADAPPAEESKPARGGGKKSK